MSKNGFESILCDLLIYLGQAERQLEKLRSQICLIMDFTPEAAFNFMDRKKKGYLSSVDLHQFIMRHDAGEGGVGEHECRRVLRYYDSDNDGRLNLNEYVYFLYSDSDFV